jgi:endonuclease III-like uncharacterized protein
MERIEEDAVLHKSRRLFQQFVVDLYSMIESQRLSFVRQNQDKIRSDFLSGIEEAVSRGELRRLQLVLELFYHHRLLEEDDICSTIVRMQWQFPKNLVILIYF